MSYLSVCLAFSVSVSLTLSYHPPRASILSLSASHSFLLPFPPSSWRLHTRACQGKCPGRNTYVLAAALAVNSGNTRIIYKDILTALADATNELSMPCHVQWTGAAAPPSLAPSLSLRRLS